jgi:RHS repeat-associated protein
MNELHNNSGFRVDGGSKSTDSGNSTPPPVSKNIRAQYIYGVRDRNDLIFRDYSPDGIAPPARHYVLTDAMFSTTAIANTTGEIQQRLRYTAFGRPTHMSPDFTPSPANPTAWQVLLHGEYYDEDTKWSNYGYRYYSAMIGRWEKRDLINERDNINLYCFVKNTPVAFFDAYGLQSTTPVKSKDCCKDPCKEALKSGLDKGDGGGVVCCNGVKHTCSWIKKNRFDDTSFDVITKCVIEHERDHLDDMDCPVTNDCTITRPGFKDGKDGKDEECHAYRVEINCLQSNIGQCKTEDCKKAVQDRIKRMEGLSRNETCSFLRYWLYRLFPFMVCFSCFILAQGCAPDNSSRKNEYSPFHIKNFDDISKDTLRNIFARILDDEDEIHHRPHVESSDKIKIRGPIKGYRFGTKKVKKTRYYSSVFWPGSKMPDSDLTVVLYEDGDYDLLRHVGCKHFWRVLLPIEFAKNDFKKLDKKTLETTVSKHVKSQGWSPDDYKIKELSLKERDGVHCWEIRVQRNHRELFETHYFLIYKEKP